MRAALAALATIVLPAAAPSAAPVPSASPARAATLSVVCQRAPLYVFLGATDRPMRARTPEVILGQRFALVSGPRTTLEGRQFYETDIPVVEPGYPPNAHYWLDRDCAIPD